MRGVHLRADKQTIEADDPGTADVLGGLEDGLPVVCRPLLVLLRSELHSRKATHAKPPEGSELVISRQQDWAVSCCPTESLSAIPLVVRSRPYGWWPPPPRLHGRTNNVLGAVLRS